MSTQLWQPGVVAAVCVADRVGQPKQAVAAIELRAEHGAVGDAHAGSARQVSLLDAAAVRAFAAANPAVPLPPGAFGENLLVDGIDWEQLPVGTTVQIGAARLAITQFGKECHHGCVIRETAGDCIMPRRGLFLKVLAGGMVRPGDPVHAPCHNYPLALLTVSDRCSRGESGDASGDRLAELLRPLGPLVARGVVPDETDRIAGMLRDWCDAAAAPALVVTTGGTGLSPRDVTPEATRMVLEREAPGLMEYARAAGAAHTAAAYLSRGVAGTRGRTLLVNLPGSVRGSEQSLAALLPLLPHALATLRGQVRDCGRGGCGTGKGCCR
ncbi:MAG TPA: molybdopterin-binding protein [bacterium]|nr:molybdopterin-binding protein [bacterium]